MRGGEAGIRDEGQAVAACGLPAVGVVRHQFISYLRIPAFSSDTILLLVDSSSRLKAEILEPRATKYHRGLRQQQRGRGNERMTVANLCRFW
jgi:hypothetical protein